MLQTIDKLEIQPIVRVKMIIMYGRGKSIDWNWFGMAISVPMKPESSYSPSVCVENFSHLRDCYIPKLWQKYYTTKYIKQPVKIEFYLGAFFFIFIQMKTVIKVRLIVTKKRNTNRWQGVATAQRSDPLSTCSVASMMSVRNFCIGRLVTGDESCVQNVSLTWNDKIGQIKCCLHSTISKNSSWLYSRMRWRNF